MFVPRWNGEAKIVANSMPPSQISSSESESCSCTPKAGAELTWNCIEPRLNEVQHNLIHGSADVCLTPSTGANVACTNKSLWPVGGRVAHPAYATPLLPFLAQGHPGVDAMRPSARVRAPSLLGVGVSGMIKWTRCSYC